MPRNRFQSILTFLHFADKPVYKPNDRKQDLVENRKRVYILDDFVFIDEELLLWERRLSFNQHIPNARSWFGIKLFSFVSKSGAVVPKPMSEILNQGYKLFVDLSTVITGTQAKSYTVTCMTMVL